MRLWISAIAIFLAIPSGVAVAADAMGMGAGAETCAQFTQAYAKKRAFAEMSTFIWAQGFMTATNVSSAARPGGSYRDLEGNTNDQRAHIRHYCGAHPSAQYAQAVLDLYQTLPLRLMPKRKVNFRTATDAKEIRPGNADAARRVSHD